MFMRLSLIVKVPGPVTELKRIPVVVLASVADQGAGRRAVSLGARIVMRRDEPLEPLFSEIRLLLGERARKLRETALVPEGSRG